MAVTTVPASRIRVIGVGSGFRRDDAAGWAVVARLARHRAAGRLPAGTELRMCDGDPARLTSLWHGAALAVVVDAARVTPPRPGAVHRLEFDPGGPVPASAGAGSHGLGVYDALGLARALGRLPERLLLYAVEAEDTAFGSGLSRPVARAVPVAARRITRDLEAFVARPPGAWVPARPPRAPSIDATADGGGSRR